MEGILILWKSSQGEATALWLLLMALRNLCFPQTRLGEALGRAGGLCGEGEQSGELGAPETLSESF